MNLIVAKVLVLLLGHCRQINRSDHAMHGIPAITSSRYLSNRLLTGRAGILTGSVHAADSNSLVTNSSVDACNLVSAWMSMEGSDGRCAYVTKHKPASGAAAGLLEAQERTPCGSNLGLFSIKAYSRCIIRSVEPVGLERLRVVATSAISCILNASRNNLSLSREDRFQKHHPAHC